VVDGATVLFIFKKEALLVSFLRFVPSNRRAMLPTIITAMFFICYFMARHILQFLENKLKIYISCIATWIVTTSAHNYAKTNSF
jgi:hypothetical protein